VRLRVGAEINLPGQAPIAGGKDVTAVIAIRRQLICARSSRYREVSAMPQSILYTAEAVSTGEGRNGHVRSSDGRVDFDMASPKSMGGSGNGSNPEELFASGYSACFHSALKGAGRKAKADMDGSTVTARVGIGPDGPGFGLAVTLLVHIPNVPAEQAREFAATAHLTCPYSRATHGNITTKTEVV
jgi:Ohr subfamily peroxiredoxin